MNAPCVKPIATIYILAFTIGCDRVEIGPDATRVGAVLDSIAALRHPALRGPSDFDDSPPAADADLF